MLALHEDWKQILKHAWSIKFNALATISGGLEVAVQIWQPDNIPKGLFAGIAALVSVVASAARLLAQQELSNDKPPTTPQ